MIVDKDGKSRSFRTSAELQADIAKDLATLTPSERQVLELILEEEKNRPANSKVGLLGEIGKLEYKHTPVDMRTFVKDDYYLGKTCDNLYPKLLDDLEELFEGGYQESIWTGSIGFGKCVHPDTEVFDVRTGRRRRAGDSGSLAVASLHEGRMVVGAAESFPSGTKPCVRLTLRGGQSLVLSSDHPVFTPRGWVEVGQLSLQDLVATPRCLPEPLAYCQVSDDEVKLIAYLLSDGGCTASITFTNETPVVLEEFVALVSALGKTRRGKEPAAAPAASQNSGKATTLNVRGVMDFVREWDLHKHSRDKRVPAAFWGLPLRQAALFLNRFWACDGSITSTKTRLIETTLSSEHLIDDLRFLLLRLGIPSRKYPKQASYVTDLGERRCFPAWVLSVSGVPNITRFLDVVGPVLGKETACAAMRAACAGIKYNTNTDVVPVGLKELRSIREELGDAGKGLTGRFGCPSHQLLGREKFQRLCSEEHYRGRLAWLADSDILWERLLRLENVGVQEVCDLSVPEFHSFVGNGVILHNTFVTSIGVCRVLYELSCLKSPHETYGLAEGSNISIACLSVSEVLAIKVVFENISNKIKSSQYFKDNFPFESTKRELRFPGNVWVAARASTDGGVLGLNVISSLMDEQNFLPQPKRKNTPANMGYQDRAATLYNSIKRRMTSRFRRYGKLPGMLFLVSSKRTVQDFTNRRVREAIASNDPTVFVRDYALWDVKPEEYYATSKFWVLAGNEQVPSRILTETEESEIDKLRETLPEGTVLIQAPEDFRGDFDRDLEGSLRDIAGVATVAISPFITRREKLLEIVDKTRKHPFTSMDWDASKGGDFRWSEMVKSQREKVYGSDETHVRPILNPKAARHAHIDASINTCATGFCVAHISHWTEVARRGDDNKTYPERAPVYVVDVILRVVPPLGEEIVLGDVRRLIYALSSHGYPITTVSFDQFQCLAAGTLVATSRGLLPIQDVVVGDLVQSRSGPRAVERVWAFGRRLTVVLRTEDKDSLEGTAQHRIEAAVAWRWYAESGRKVRLPVWGWVKMGELRKGDVVRRESVTEIDSPDLELRGDKNTLGWNAGGRRGVLADWELPSQMTPVLAEWLGLIWGDGDVSQDGVRLTVTEEESEDAAGIFERLFGFRPVYRPHHDGSSHGVLRVSSRGLVRWLRGNGMQKPLIPGAVLGSSRATRRAFLRGLFATDGSVDQNEGRVTLSTKHRALADQVRVLLKVDVGLDSRLVTAARGYAGDYIKEGKQYVVSVRGSRAVFADAVGFSYQSKQRQLEAHRGVKGRRLWTRIDRVEVGEALVYDLQVAEDPSYNAAGFVSHNSADSLQQLAQKGYDAQLVSMVRTPHAYENLKLAIYEGRLRCYPYPALLDELRQLERDPTTGKIDHPPGGEKDLSDALAGALWTLSQRQQSVGDPLPPSRGSGAVSGDAWMPDRPTFVPPPLPGEAARAAEAQALPLFMRGPARKEEDPPTSSPLFGRGEPSDDEGGWIG